MPSGSSACEAPIPLHKHRNIASGEHRAADSSAYTVPQALFSLLVLFFSFSSQLSHFSVGFGVCGNNAFPVEDPKEQVLVYFSAGSLACLCVRRWVSGELGSLC